MTEVPNPPGFRARSIESDHVRFLEEKLRPHECVSGGCCDPLPELSFALLQRTQLLELSDADVTDVGNQIAYIESKLGVGIESLVESVGGSDAYRYWDLFINPDVNSWAVINYRPGCG